MRYFFSTDGYHKPVNVYRFDRKADIQQAWNVTEWNETEKVSRFLMLGEGWLEEVEEAAARKVFPQAFKSGD
jgi:hypothetical protein